MATKSYTIYIKYPNDVSNNKCKPNINEEANYVKPSNNTSEGGSSFSGSISVSKVVRTIKNPLGSLLGNASKVAPAIAGSLIAIKVADQIVETALPFYEGYTGDYRPSFNYANTKSVISAVMNPLGTLTSIATRQMEIYRQNTKITQERMLTGNSIINTYGGKSSN